MRKLLIGVLIGCLLVLSGGAASRIVAHSLTTPHCAWELIGTITESQAYPGVNDRDYTAVTSLSDAKTVQWLDIPEYANAVQLRYQTNADADSTTVALLACADDYVYDSTTLDDFVYAGQHVLTGGQQLGPGNTGVFVDTIVATSGALFWSVLDSATNRVAIATADLRGYKRLVIIATTLQAGSTLRVQARWY